MCGIAGIFNERCIDPYLLKQMSQTIRHRGPDDEGYILYNLNNISCDCKGNDTISNFKILDDISCQHKDKYTLGMVHRRLSIIDLTAMGHQPMRYMDKYSIVFNGEIYNYLEIRKELINSGYSFKTNTDTEVIMAAIDKWGIQCVTRFVGMWAFALYDEKNFNLYLSRDRFGIKPLYYITIGSEFAFASEIKALLELKTVSRRVNITSLSEFFVYGNTADPSGNLFNDVNVLPEGHNLCLSLKDYRIKIKQYYDLEKASLNNNNHPKDQNKVEYFRELYDNSINLHLRSDVPVGVCLSGGLDSSSIAASTAKKLPVNGLKTYTAAYKLKHIDESNYAMMVANMYPNIEPHLTYPDINCFWDTLDKQIWHHDRPFHSTSLHAQWEVMKLANANHSKVLLNGQGSDEILGGYYNFAGIYLIESFKNLHFRNTIHEYKQLKQNFTKNINTACYRAAYSFLPSTLKKIVRSKKRVGSNIISNDYNSVLSNLKPPDFHGNTYFKLSLNAIKHGLQQLLRYEDRISMAFSIESRVPFLDHRLVEYSVALNNNWKIRDGWTKYILRRSSDSNLPHEVTWRKDKMGFLTPAKEWRVKLHSELDKYINSISIPSYFKKEMIDNYLKMNMNEPTHLSEFWKIIITLKWMEVFKVTF
jgi:asparagine synthase (glutamine-hydrolysing)